MPKGAVAGLTNTYATELAIPDAPAGNYVVNWSVALNNTAQTASAPSRPECLVSIGGATSGQLQAVDLPSEAVLGGSVGELSATQVVALTSPSGIALECDLALGNPTNVTHSELNATLVDTVTPAAG